MKALTIWQPYASLIIIGAKPYEFRGRSYLRYPGHPQCGDRIAIHAAVRPVKREEIKGLQDRLNSDDDDTMLPKLANPLLAAVLMAHKSELPRLLPLGVVLGTAIIGEPQPPPSPDHNWAWPLTDIEKFDVPVPARGLQGFWEWKPDCHAYIMDEAADHLAHLTPGRQSSNRSPGVGRNLGRSER